MQNLFRLSLDKNNKIPVHKNSIRWYTEQNI